MSELRVIALLILGPALWMLGGYQAKAWRRVAWPLIAFGLLWSAAPWWRLATASLALYGTTTLPYGERTPWWLRLAVFSSYALPGAAFSPIPALWCAGVSALGLGLLMFASHKINRIPHKVWEATAGVIQAATLLICLGR